MIAVIIAGGKGSRLWPLSTNDYPKHLLKIHGDKSLLQYTYDRAKTVADKIFVITENSHVNQVAEQLPELKLGETIVSEPGRRGTASCIVYALSHISKSIPDANNEPIVFMHADHLIRDISGFTDSVRYAATVSEAEKSIVLLGVEPTYPATGFGYIERGANEAVDSKQPFYQVAAFKEKPDLALATQYLESGRYLWNMGFFVAPLEVFTESMRLYAPDLFTNYQTLLQASEEVVNEAYLTFVDQPIDTALIERIETGHLFVVAGTFDWMDVGSFGDLHASYAHDEDQNYIEGYAAVENVHDAYIVNKTEVPLAVIGLDNVVVVNTPNGILVANKSQAQKVKEVVQKLKEMES
jgi:mannose-1-phosphate guanylyltransferase/mannose-6-phosphate isomerase